MPQMGLQQDSSLDFPVLGLTGTPLLSPSPEKEAFKKRQKLQQDNGEETDENEVEEVSGLRAHTEVVWVWSIVIAPHGEGPSPAWLCKQAGGVAEPRAPCWSREELDGPQPAPLWSKKPTSFWD